MAQLSEDAELQAVFDDLFAAAATGASAFGFRLGAGAAVRVNPPKSEVVMLGPDDQVALISGSG